MRNIGHRFSSTAVMLLVLSSAAFATHDTASKDRQDAARSDHKAMLWHVHANECALGETPPPGTNCSQ